MDKATLYRNFLMFQIRDRRETLNAPYHIHMLPHSRGDIRADKDGLPAGPTNDAHRLCTPLRIHVRDDHAGTLSGKGERQCMANARAPTGSVLQVRLASWFHATVGHKS